MFIVDLNATIKRDFANLAADLKKILLEIGVTVDGLCKKIMNSNLRNPDLLKMEC